MLGGLIRILTICHRMDQTRGEWEHYRINVSDFRRETRDALSCAVVSVGAVARLKLETQG